MGLVAPHLEDDAREGLGIAETFWSVDCLLR